MEENIPFIKPVNRVKLHEEIKQILFQGIINRELRPGDKLPTERSLAENLNVNRSTVREALGNLKELELIEIRQGDGAYVRDFHQSGNLGLIWELLQNNTSNDENLLATLLEIRRIIVPEMATHAALHRSEEDLMDLESLIEGSQDMPMPEKDIRIHQTIAKAANNLIYLIMLNFFNTLMRKYGHLYFDDEKNIRRSSIFHKDIYQAIKEKNPEESRRIMREVLIYAEDRVLESLNQRKRRGEDE